jgi:hypothetical protein
MRTLINIVVLLVYVGTLVTLGYFFFEPKCKAPAIGIYAGLAILVWFIWRPKSRGFFDE